MHPLSTLQLFFLSENNETDESNFDGVIQIFKGGHLPAEPIELFIFPY